MGKGHHPSEETEVRLGTIYRQDGQRKDERHPTTRKELLRVTPEDMLGELLDHEYVVRERTDTLTECDRRRPVGGTGLSII